MHAERTVQQILFPTTLVWYEVRNKSALPRGMRWSAWMDGCIIPPDSSRWAVRWVCFFFTPCVLFSRLFVRNKWQLLWRYHTELASLPTTVTLWIVDCLKSSRPDSKDVDSQALQLSDYCTSALASGLSHCHFQKETLGRLTLGLLKA